MVETGYEDRLKELEDEEGWEELEADEMKLTIDEFWKPEEGDEIKGIFLERRKFTTEDDLEFYTIVIQTNDGIYGVTENKFLKQRLEDIKEGDGIKIKYLGKVKMKTGRFKYKSYAVRIKHFKEGETTDF
jgi:hypothetical protein